MNSLSFGNILTGILFLSLQVYRYFDNQSVVSKPHVVLGFLLIAIGIWGHYKSKNKAK
jgi:hypothetical protein